MTFGKLHPLALGISIAIIGGVAAFGAALFADTFLYGKTIILGVGTLYVTYNPTFIGSVFIGAGVAGAGLVGGFIASVIYNMLLNLLKDNIPLTSKSDEDDEDEDDEDEDEDDEDEDEEDAEEGEKKTRRT